MPPDPSQLGHFLNGLRQEESGNRYNLRPNAAGASGAYQFLDSTWGGYGGYREAWMAPQSVQDQRAAQLASEYYDQFGSWTAVAQAWLGGPGSVGKNVTDRYTGITSNQYAANVLKLAGMSAAGQQFPTSTTYGARSGSRIAGATTSPNDIGTQISNLDGILANPVSFSLSASGALFPATSSPAPASQSSASRSPEPAPTTGLPGLVKPVDGPISEGFGGSEKGIDIAVPLGTQVHAPVGGTVEHLNDGPNGFGNYIVLHGDDGRTYTLGHLGDFLTPPGHVDAGAVIATSSGAPGTSHSTGPHIELRIQDASGNFINPQPAYEGAGSQPAAAAAATTPTSEGPDLHDVGTQLSNLDSFLASPVDLSSQEGAGMSAFKVQQPSTTATTGAAASAPDVATGQPAVETTNVATGRPDINPDLIRMGRPQ